MPKEATEGSAGLDIVCTETTTIEKGQVVMMSTGIILEPEQAIIYNT